MHTYLNKIQAIKKLTSRVKSQTFKKNGTFGS
jgi:hypothetical protein